MQYSFLVTEFRILEVVHDFILQTNKFCLIYLILSNLVSHGPQILFIRHLYDENRI